MKIQELLIEEQVDEISLNGVGKGIGKAVGAAAKGIGAVAGGAVGAWDAMKKGYQAGKATVGAGGDEPPATRSTSARTGAATGGTGGTGAVTGGTGAAPAATGGTGAAPAVTGGTGAPGQAGASAQGQQTSPATAQTNQPAQTGTASTPTAGGTMYAQLKGQIDQLDANGKKQVLAALKKELGTAKPAAKAGAKPATGGAGAFGQMAGQLGGPQKSSTGGTITQTPTGLRHTASPTNPNQARATVEYQSKFLGIKL